MIYSTWMVFERNYTGNIIKGNHYKPELLLKPAVVI